MSATSAPVRAVDLARVVTTEDVIEMLRARVDAAGSQLAFARATGVHPPDVSAVLNKHRIPTRAIRTACGVEDAWVVRGAK